MLPRHRADALFTMAHDLLRAAGLDDAIARSVARTLLDGDLLGHDTHGLALLAPYLCAIRQRIPATDPALSSAVQSAEPGRPEWRASPWAPKGAVSGRDTDNGA